MRKQKIVSMILTAIVVGAMGIVLINNYTGSPSKRQIKVMSYKPSGEANESKNENGYEIDKYENTETVAWINDREVLTLTKKSDFVNPDQTIPIRYCSIYNLNTKESKDFNDVNIDEFLGVSPDKKYVLYAEARTIPKVGSDEWQKALNSGDLLHKNVKLLDLSTGQITDVNTEKRNSDSQFIWISNNKILANYFDKWQIIDTIGKVYAEGSYNGGTNDSAWISGVDEIKDLGDSVEGKFYYTQSTSGKEGVSLSSVDVKTKEITNIFSNQFSTQADEKGKTIIMDSYDNNGGQNADGIFENRTFGALVLDETGKVLQNIKFPKGLISQTNQIGVSDFILSPDGSKAAYVETANNIGSYNSNTATDTANNTQDSSVLKIIDTKTGEIKEIVKASSLIDSNARADYISEPLYDQNSNVIGQQQRLIDKKISNICWDSTGNTLSFTYGNSCRGNSSINTYVVSFDRWGCRFNG